MKVINDRFNFNEHNESFIKWFWENVENAPYNDDLRMPKAIMGLAGRNCNR